MLEGIGSIISGPVNLISAWLSEKIANRFGNNLSPLKQVVIQSIVFAAVIFPVVLLIFVVLGFTVAALH